MQIKSTVRVNFPRIKQLTQVAITALEMTVETLYTEVVQAQVMPFDAGHLERDSLFVDYSHSRQEEVTLVVSTPYTRCLYYYPECDFQTDEGPFAGGEWYEPWPPGGVSQDFVRDTFKRFYKKVGGVWYWPWMTFGDTQEALGLQLTAMSMSGD